MTISTTETRTPNPLASSRAREILTGSVTSIATTLLIVIVVGLSWIGPSFLQASNITIIGSFVAVPMLIAAFSGFALLAGVVDLSIGSMVGFGSAAFGTLLSMGWNIYLAAAATLACCIGFGAIIAETNNNNGADAIAATLGMLVALRGVCYLIAGPTGTVVAFDPDFYALVNQPVGPLPLLFVGALVAIATAAFVVMRTRSGLHVPAVGGDDRAATRAGISVPRVRTFALLLSAFGAGLGGILYVGQLGSASNLTGTGLEFQVYAAMMIGGYSILRGGVGNPVGAALGLLVVAGTSNILDVRAVSPYFTNIIVGLLLLAAVLLDRLRGGDAFE